MYTCHNTILANQKTYLWIGQHSPFSKQAKPTLKPTKSLSKPSTTTTPQN